MQHLRKDYDAIQPWPVKRPHIAKINGITREHELTDDHLDDDLQPIIPDDEPVFLLRARDISAPIIVRFWAEVNRNIGTDPLLCERVREWADTMSQYGREHGSHLPDTPEGMLR